LRISTPPTSAVRSLTERMTSLFSIIIPMSISVQ
jgi:hypothetical protein